MKAVADAKIEWERELAEGAPQNPKPALKKPAARKAMSKPKQMSVRSPKAMMRKKPAAAAKAMRKKPAAAKTEDDMSSQNWPHLQKMLRQLPLRQ